MDNSSQPLPPGDSGPDGSTLAYALEERMRQALVSVQPPPELRDRLLRTTRDGAGSSASPFPFNGFLAAAALIVLCGAVAWMILPPRPLSLASVVEEMTRLQREDRVILGMETSDPEQIRDWLRENRGLHQFDLPPGLGKRIPAGCQVLSIQGHQVSLVCFQAGDGRIAHLVIMDRAHLAEPPEIGVPTLQKDGGFAFAAWSTGGRSFLLTGPFRLEELRAML